VQTLKIVADNKSPTLIDTPADTVTGGMADKTACLLTYLNSLELAAEHVHGDNDDWRYGRYLFHAAMVEALKK